MKYLIRLAVLLTVLSPIAGFAQGTVCETRETTYDSRDVSCTVPSAAGTLKFRADFSGGHDDTLATMTVLVDDRPLACESGGKLRLFAEDGNVSLFCRFTGAPARSVIKATIKWSHADYVGASLYVD